MPSEPQEVAVEVAETVVHAVEETKPWGELSAETDELSITV